MVRPTDLLPTQYQVVRLTTGQDIVGMTKDTGAALQITLPMICHLTVSLPEQGTVATFYPYSPMSSDVVISIPKTIISHATALNEQFIPQYDKASSTWLGMIEHKRIPLIEKTNNQRAQKMIEDEIERLMSHLDYDVDELLERGDESSYEKEFLRLSKPKDGKIH